MKCKYCGGQTVERVTRYDEDLGYRVVIVNHVPGYECNRCGEISYSGEVEDQLKQIVTEAERTGTDEIVVREWPSR